VGLLDRAVVRLLPAVPRPVVRRLSMPYIAGSTLDDARRTVAALNAEGKLATVDVLGEEVSRPEEAEAIARAYADVLRAIEDDGLRSTVSVKLTGLGLKVDRALCARLLEQVVRDAAARRLFVRIDMEDATTTDDALVLYRGLRAGGHENVGIVLQAYLRRTLADVDELVRRSFVACLDALLDAGCFVAVATHDEELIEAALRRVAGLAADAYELQMLLGVRERRATELVAAGHRLRVYVPYGRRWYEYSLRRLQENPRVAGYVARDVVARGLRRG
jgi:proline dehydrogenase